MRSTLALSSMFAVVVTPFVAERAEACGGLFCSNTSPTPVDQSAEKILFEVRDDGTVTATVEIKYFGNPGDFAWIVPVAGTPDFVEVAPKDELLLLDSMTRPNIIQPTQDFRNCNGGGGFGCPTDNALRGGIPVADSAGEGEGEGINVTNYPSVGPFDEIIVVDGGEPAPLIAFLNDNGYRVTEAMEPFIAQYTLEGYQFLATKLRSDADTRDMVPIRFHCPQPNPHIPLRLTAIAAEPDMGFLVFVASNERYQPANYAELEIDVDDVHAINGQTNYFALVSKLADEAGGRAFVVERAEGALVLEQNFNNTFLGTETEQEARDSVAALIQRRPFITRMYTRMSAEEMIEDPFFVPADSTETYDGVIDLSDRQLDVCGNTPVAPTCGTLYCGEGDACAVGENGAEGCVCRNGHVARATTGPTGASQIICTSLEIDVHQGENSNPCAGSVCGEGTCLPVNDRPTCACREGSVAILDAGNNVRCTPMVSDVFESDQLLKWPKLPSINDPVDDDNGGGCAAQAGGSASLALLFAAGLVVRAARSRQRR